MGQQVRIAGQTFPFELVVACIVFLGFCLLALRLRTLLFLTIVVLFLPSLDLGSFGLLRLARYLRWAFLVAIVAKGLTTNFRLGFRPREWSPGHLLVLALSGLVVLSMFWSISPTWTVRK